MNSSNSPSLDEVLRAAMRHELEEVVEHALAEQRALLAPIPSCADLLRRRAALSIRETADVLGVGEDTVRAWLRSGELVDAGFSGARRLIGTDQILTKLVAANAKRRNCGEAPE